jgi:hypothetical protein
MKTLLMIGLMIVCLSLASCAWLRPPTEPSAAARKSLGDSKVRSNPDLGNSTEQGFQNGESVRRQQQESDREITREINRPGR